MTIVTGFEHKLVGLQHIKSSSLSHQKKQTMLGMSGGLLSCKYKSLLASFEGVAEDNWR